MKSLIILLSALGAFASPAAVQNAKRAATPTPSCGPACYGYLDKLSDAWCPDEDGKCLPNGKMVKCKPGKEGYNQASAVPQLPPCASSSPSVPRSTSSPLSSTSPRTTSGIPASSNANPSSTKPSSTKPTTSSKRTSSTAPSASASCGADPTPSGALLLNGDFETGCSAPWTEFSVYKPLGSSGFYQASDNVTQVMPCGSDCKSGSYYAHIYYDNSDGHWAYVNSGFRQTVTLVAGMNYTVTLWAKGIQGSLIVQYSTATSEVSEYVASTGDWEQISYRIVGEAGERPYLAIGATTAGRSDWYFDDVKIVQN